MRLITGRTLAVVLGAVGGWAIMAPGLTSSLVEAAQFETISINHEVMLKAHNDARGEVGVPDLSWSDTLAKAAAEWAAHLGSTKDCKMEHASNEKLKGTGENLSWFSAVTMYDSDDKESKAKQKKTSTDAVKGWNDEKEYYKHGETPDYKKCGHYTQVVWRNTKEVGCAAVVCTDGENPYSQVWVCRYSPGGNVVGEQVY